MQTSWHRWSAGEIAMTFRVYPAIDLRGGQVVRLQTGDYAAETVYGDDPLQTAALFAEQGASWIHVVDLDAARSGDPVNRPIIAAIAASLRGSCSVQSGGGVRTLDDAEELAGLGVRRVVMGSAAIRQPDLVGQVAQVVEVAVGLDHRGGELATDGWTVASGRRLDDVIGLYGDASAFVVTDISRDGMLSGPDRDGLTSLAQQTPIAVIASGGVSSLEDIAELAAIGSLDGVIVGRALYEGRFSVAEALATVAEADR